MFKSLRKMFPVVHYFAEPGAGGGGNPDPNPPAPGAGDPPAFAIPDQFKDKGWATKVKSVDDLYKLVDSQDALIGKKTIEVPFDYSKATGEEIEKHMAMFRPEKAEEYELKDMGEEAAEMSKIFHETGLSKYQADKLSKGLISYSQAKAQAAHGVEQYKALAKEAFGENYEPELAKAEAFLKNAFPKEYDSVIKSLPNKNLIFLQKMASMVQDKYGITDGGAKLLGVGAGAPPANDQEKMDAYWKEMEELSKRNHSMADVQAIQKKYGIIK